LISANALELNSSAIRRYRDTPAAYLMGSFFASRALAAAIRKGCSIWDLMQLFTGIRTYALVAPLKWG